MTTCSPTGIRDFPIQTSVTITDDLNKSITEEFLLDIQWGLRSTAPQFVSNQGYVNEGSSGSAAQVTTLRLQGNLYTLQAVIFTQPQHTSFLKSALASSVQGEIVLVFKTSGQIAEPYLFVCVPLIAGSTTTPSAYLEALRKDVLPGKPIGLDSLLPAKPDFLSYSTCLQRTAQQQSVAVQARVLVFVNGLTYTAAAIQELVRRVPGSNTQTTQFPALRLPDNIVAQSLTTPFRITTTQDYVALLRFSTYVPSATPTPGPPGTRTDPTSAYQCVPLKPDRDVKNGQITIDTATGKPLSSVLADKAADESDLAPSSKVTPAQIEKALSIALGIFVLFLVGLLLTYIVTRLTAKPSVGSVTFGPLRSWFARWGPIGLGALVMGAAGFVAGMFIRT